MVIKFVKQWWFLISAFALLMWSMTAFGLGLAEDIAIMKAEKNIEHRFVPREEMMLRFDHVDKRLELIMDELGVEDVPLQHPIASQP